MRLHRLTLTAFGPFPQTVEVDFEALAADGLFLIHGDTGAGKSTILDGVCFALYGEVPGFRDDAKTLHSHHAPDGRGPVVELDVTLTNRRLLITRTPEWHRPKKRGSGTVLEGASVRVSERLPDGGERFLTGHHSEAADLVSAEMGLDRQQFCQVALLPQGGFARFLQASQDDRQGLLRNLFDTEIFTRAEQWLAEHRTTLGKHEREAAGSIRDLAQRFAEVVEEETPAALGEPAGFDGLAAWTAHHQARIRELATELAPALATSEAAEPQLDRVRQAAALLAKQQGEHAIAVQQRDELAQRRPERDRWQRELDLAHASAVLKPHLDQADRRKKAADRARQDLIGQLAALPSDIAALAGQPRPLSSDGELDWALPDVDGDSLSRTEGERSRQLHEAEAAIGDETRRSKLFRDRTTTSKKLEDLAVRREKVAIALAELPDQRDGLLVRREHQLTLAADKAAAELTLTEAQQRKKSADRRDTLIGQLAAAEDERRAVTDRLHAAQAQYLEVRQRRLTGMAAELAGALISGEPCAVCGSAEHPAPAQPAVNAVTAADEEQAKALAETHLDQRSQADRDVERFRTQLAEIAEQIGELTTTQAKTAVTETRKRVRVATEAEKLVAELDAQLETLNTFLADQEKETVEIGQEEAVAAAHLDSLHGQITELTERIDSVRGQDKTLKVRVSRLTDELAAIRSALNGLGKWQQAAEELVAARREASDRLEASEFADWTAARAAALTEPAMLSRAEQIADFADQFSKAQGRAEDPVLVAAVQQAPPDVSDSEAAYEAARLRTVELRRRHDVAVGKQERIEQLTAAVASDYDRWRPLHAEHEVANRIAQLVEGKSSDSDIRMTLSTYVLTHRFRQVVTAANTRLGQVTSNRYLLRHVAEHDTGRRASGRNGLGLSVIDAWTGQDRRPATLSGGETFLVSLCLALGLSDVVLAEAGGTQLGSLFVDEGFGSLDEDALDQVIDVLDGLRSGGRTVGLVSHVAELRRRIPTRLHVRKTATGSSITIPALAFG